MSRSVRDTAAPERGGRGGTREWRGGGEKDKKESGRDLENEWVERVMWRVDVCLCVCVCVRERE